MKFSAGFLQPSEASCGYEFNRQTRDVFKKNLEPRDALCFLNEQLPNAAIYDTPDANENCRTSEMNAKQFGRACAGCIRSRSESRIRRAH
jgi:hypothetical protein